MERKNSVNRLVGLAILTAVVVVLQLVGNFIKVGAFSVSLVLIPIVVGAAIYGPGAGAYLGAVFGGIVLVSCVTGADAGGFILWSANWFFTAVICLVKSTLAGFLAGLVYRTVEKKNRFAGVITAAVVCPVVNTGIFCAGLAIFFPTIMVEWAGGSNLVYYVLFGLVGINFLLELAANVVCSPAIVRILQYAKKA